MNQQKMKSMNHKKTKFNALPKQREFLLSDKKISLFIAGIGSGKTYCGCVKILKMPAGSRGLVIAPTYKTITDATQTTFFKVAEEILGEGCIKSHNKSDNVTILSNGTEILWRSAENFDILRGLEVDWVYIDEACFLNKSVYDVALGRLRGSIGPLVLWITSSPGTDGKQNWVFKEFFAIPRDNVEIITARTDENSYLPEDYINTLKAQYSTTQQARELNAEWVDVGGNRIKENWLVKKEQPITGKVIVGIDLAISTKASADYTAMVATDVTNTTKHVFKVQRYKKSFLESMNEIEKFCKEVNAHIVHIESVAFQAAAVQELTTRLAPKGIIVKPVHPKGDKLTRFSVHEASIEAGLVTFSNYLPSDFFEELVSFTGVKDQHDDYIDSLVLSLSFSSKSGSFQFVTNY